MDPCFHAPQRHAAIESAIGIQTRRFITTVNAQQTGLDSKIPFIGLNGSGSVCDISAWLSYANGARARRETKRSVVRMFISHIQYMNLMFMFSVIKADKLCISQLAQHVTRRIMWSRHQHFVKENIWLIAQMVNGTSNDHYYIDVVICFWICVWL